MYKYHCLNPIAGIGLNQFSDTYAAVEDMNEADAVLVRSAVMHELEFGENLKVIARAGAGVNNIPLDRCAEEGIVVFNTPGANANGVKEMVLAGLLLASRDIVGGIEWVKANKEDSNIAKSAEKAKKAFAGCELEGKKLGVIGLGAIGVLVANAAVKLGMEVYGYDPYLSVDAAWKLSRQIYHAKTTEEIYKECDYITIHVPAMESTKGMINAEALSLMKDGVIILNYARDVLVDEVALLEAMAAGKVKKYVTDFANPTVAGKDNVIVTPHLAASTEESEDNCAKMAVKEVMEFLENGNIRNSVNYPNCEMGLRGEYTRITIMHRNVPNMIGQFSTILAEDGINIANMTNKSRNAYAYTMIDVENEVTDVIVEDLKKVKEVLRVRVIA
ncbi:MAG: phosphoglycerate dehydrogenase [Tyzzerella sp.]|nr:phosphoglycerate dehydrogenase [Tyzzerella sp.]